MIRYLTFVILCLFFISCKSSGSSTSGNANKIDSKSGVGLKGNWTISSVSYPGQEYFKATSFNIDDSQCFVGSTWKFVSNNNTGEMMLNKPGCSGYASKITWYINKEGNFVMKYLNEGVKAKHTLSGYVLKLENLTADSFQLIDKVSVGGQTKDIVYQFNRVN